MKLNLTIAVAVLAALVLTPMAAAQFDTGGANAQFNINNQDPNSLPGQVVTVAVPGTLDLQLSSGSNAFQANLMLWGPTNAVAAPTPWGGSIDVGTPAAGVPGNLIVMWDSLGGSTGTIWDQFAVTDQNGNLNVSIAVSAGLAGIPQNGFQCVMVDATNPPFNFDNTQAGEPNYFNGQLLELNTGDDNSIQVQFVGTSVFNYYGTTYTEIYVNANAVISFTGPLGFPGAFFAPTTVAQIADVPHIAANWADYNPIGNDPNDGVLYDESGGTARINWGGSLNGLGMTSQMGVSHFAQTDLNEMEVILTLDDGTGTVPGEGTIAINYIALDPSSNVAGDGTFGIFRGAGLGAQNWTQNFHQAGGVVGFTDDSLFEEHNPSGAINALNLVGYDGAGAAPCYNNGVAVFNGNVLTFAPNSPIVTTGDFGYTASITGSRQNDAIDTDIASGALGGGDTIIICGWFGGWTGTGPAAVTFDPANVLGGGPQFGIITGVLDDSGAHPLGVPVPDPKYRDMEGLQVIVPPAVGVGAVDIEVTFDDGSTVTIPNAWTYTPNNSTLTTYAASNPPGATQLIDDGIVTHTLDPTLGITVIFGGTFYSSAAGASFDIGSNGYIHFDGVVSGDFTPTVDEFVNGIRTPTPVGGPYPAPRPTIAVAWTDLNRVSAGSYVDVLEDGITGEVHIDFQNQAHWDSLLPAGDFGVTLNSPVGPPGSITFRHTNYLPGAPPDVTPIIGVTPGTDDPLAGYPINDINLSDPGTGIGSGSVYVAGHLFQAFGGGGATAPAFPEAVDLQTVNGTGVWDMIDLTGGLGGFMYGL